jgi:hypothetical protein
LGDFQSHRHGDHRVVRYGTQQHAQQHHLLVEDVSGSTLGSSSLYVNEAATSVQQLSIPLIVAVPMTSITTGSQPYVTLSMLSEGDTIATGSTYQINGTVLHTKETV